MSQVWAKDCTCTSLACACVPGSLCLSLLLPHQSELGCHMLSHPVSSWHRLAPPALHRWQPPVIVSAWCPDNELMPV